MRGQRVKLRRATVQPERLRRESIHALSSNQRPILRTTLPWTYIAKINRDIHKHRTHTLGSWRKRPIHSKNRRET